MSYRLIKGEVGLVYQGTTKKVGSQPDGDSVWFKPDKPNLLKNFNGRTARYNGGGFAQLRFEGIDALEVHYQGEHQQIGPAKKTRDELLDLIGFTAVQWVSEKEVTVSSSAPASVRGYILTNGLDGTNNHRPIAFVFTGSTNRPDGSNLFLDAAMMGQSLNAELMRRGLVYPLYYETLPPDLRDELTGMTVDAFNSGLELWNGVDTSNDSNTIQKMEDLRELAIWPKLFRRLKDYFADHSNGSLSGFDQALRSGMLKDDELTIVSESTGHIEAGANMHDIYEIHQNRLRMKYYPEELIIKGD